MSAVMEAARKLVAGAALDELDGDYAAVATEIMEGSASPVAMSAFLTATSMRGVAPGLLAAFAATLRRHAVGLFSGAESPAPGVRVDTCGTGGDHSGSFNVSTAAALVVAGAGLPVVKHGNRGFTSKSGSADVLEALGVDIMLPPEQMARRLERSNFAFLFAPNYHPAMRHVGPVRRELGFRTLFNLAGPLANPAGATHQVLGVYDRNLIEPMAKALNALGVSGALVVHGHGGLDELTLDGPNEAMWLHAGKLSSVTLSASEFGLRPAQPSDLQGGTAAENAAIISDILAGKGPAGARDIVLFNAAAAIAVVEGNLDLSSALDKAAQSLLSGAAANVLRLHRGDQ